MTLRGRLTAAFLAMVLGPVLLGALFVAATLTSVAQQRSLERLDLAASAVRNSVGEVCTRLRTVAGAVAMLQDPVGQASAAAQLVAQGLASAVLGTDAAGTPTFVTTGGPLWPWVDCATGEPARMTGANRVAGPERTAGSPSAEAAAPTAGTALTTGPASTSSRALTTGPAPIRAVAARVELRDGSGTLSGTISAAQRVDGDFVARLGAVTGTDVSLPPEVDPGDADPGDVDPGDVPSGTERVGSPEAGLPAPPAASGRVVTRAVAGRYVRRVAPSPGQPLPLVLSVSADPPETPYAVLLGTAALFGLFAVLSAWRLAGPTTRSLAGSAQTTTPVTGPAAGGASPGQAPVRSRDEVGRLLAVLGDTLASTHDLQRMLRVILHHARVATGARAGVLLLLDPAAGELVGRCAEGLGGDRAALDRLRVPLGSGLLGTVAATGEPRRGRTDGTWDRPDGPQPQGRVDETRDRADDRADGGEDPGTGEPRCRTYLAVPFAVPAAGSGPPAVPAADDPAAGRPLGVLALYDRLDGDDFDEADLVTLQTFAGHAAVAVQNVRLHEEAQRLSLTDPLTGLWNYRYLMESIRREVERANRFGRMLSVLALDLDRFKEVNDTYGHAAGDAVLVEFARRIRGVVREVDLVFRQGGEEFVVLLPETDARGAATVAERLGAAIREAPIPVRPSPGAVAALPAAVSVTVSIGIAVYPDHGSTGSEVLDTADDALYAAKAAGRDTYRVAAERNRPMLVEIPVTAGLVSPADGMPWAGYRQSASISGGIGGGTGGASFGPHPPRPARGR